MGNSLDTLSRLGGQLALDFVNTIDPRFGDDRIEYLTDPAVLADWARWIGAIDDPLHAELTRAAAADPTHGDRTLRRALRLRNDLYEVLRPGREAAGTARPLEAVTHELRRAATHLVLRAGDDGYALDVEPTPKLDYVLWLVTHAAAELLTSPLLHRVRECDATNCGWLFLDTSKSGRRRWCSMEICGNREKAKRYRTRLRARQEGP